MDLPLIIGHRGAKGVKEENTPEAFDYACRSGVSCVELDAMLSKDGEAFVFHDETVDRMCPSATGRLDAMDSEDILRLKTSGGNVIPRLAEVLSLIKGYDGVCVNVEIKPSRPELAERTAGRVWEVVKKINFDDPDRLLFSSFSLAALKTVSELAPHIGRGVLAGSKRFDWKKAAKRLKAYSVHYDYALLTPELIRDILNEGYLPAAYTVNAVETAKRLADEGVRSFFTDFPVEMKAAFTK